MNYYFKNISYEKMIKVINAIKTNTHLKCLSMVNIDMPDSVAKVSVNLNIKY